MINFVSAAILALAWDVSAQGSFQMRMGPKCDVKGDNWRFDCFPQGRPYQEECERRGCCWKPAGKPLPPSPSGLTVPQCYFPSNYETYRTQAVIKSGHGAQVRAVLKKDSPYPGDIQSLVANFIYVTETCLRIAIRDASHTRWEVPPLGSKVHDIPKPRRGGLDYNVTYPSIGQPFGFRISRNSGEILMETAGALILSDQFLQLSTLLPSSLLYGLGEHRRRLAVSTNWTRIALWNRDHIPQENVNLYGTHPLYINKDSAGWHGVFLYNSNALDIIVQPAPAITWRTIGGILDFYIFTGPTLGDVVAQYTNVVGRSFIPPYWALGFHLCWQLYGTANNTLETMNRVRRYGIPQDVQWNDIDYAYKSRVFTTDEEHFGNQARLAAEIHKRGMHYIIMVDCGISNSATPGRYEPYDLGKEMGIFINDTDNKPIVGKVWPGTTVWPDFLNNASQKYWTTIAGHFHKKVPFDGMWVDMNEISSFSDGSIHGCDTKNHYDVPPYLPGVEDGELYKHTICPHAMHQISAHYNVHNLYGSYETMRSYRALVDIRGKRPFVISRATFPGHGQYGGHWSGDNAGTWHDMHMSISSMLHMNMFGISMTGSDICGFHSNATTEICTRWHQLGAFYVFSRNHNALDCLPQDPGQFGPESAASTRKAFLTRYSLLPYLYLLLFRSHVYGDTVARPLLWEYPDDPKTHNLDTQFLWGPALMVSPVLEQNATALWVYFPLDRWYNFYTGVRVEETGRAVYLQAPLDVINLHLRGGHILPMQEPALTTTVSRSLPVCLLVALDARLGAEGYFYWDDGDSVDTYERGLYHLLSFKANEEGLWSKTDHLGYMVPPVLGNVTVFGLNKQPTEVKLDGQSVAFTFSHTVLYIPGLTVSLVKNFNITWGDKS